MVMVLGLVPEPIRSLVPGTSLRNPAAWNPTCYSYWSNFAEGYAVCRAPQLFSRTRPSTQIVRRTNVKGLRSADGLGPADKRYFRPHHLLSDLCKL